MRLLKMWFVFFVAVLFLPLSSIAVAEENYRVQGIDFDMKHSLSGYDGVESINAMGDDIVLERSLWPPMVRDSEGLYWGNMIPASSASVDSDGVTGLRMVFELGPEVISSGVSDFWVRIPFDGTNIEYMSFAFDIDTVENQFWRTVDEDSLEALISTGPWLYRNDGGARKIVWDSQGVFVRLYEPLSTTYSRGDYMSSGYVYPNNYTFVLDVVVRAFNGTQPVMLLSEESYLEEYFTVVSKGERSFERTLANATPALAFIFMQGLTGQNLFSFLLEPTPNTLTIPDGSKTAFTSLPTRDTNYVFLEQMIDPDVANNSYITVSIPFLGTSVWDVTMKLVGGATSHYFYDAGWVGPPNRFSFFGSTNSISDHLTMTCPFPILRTSSVADVNVVVIARPRSAVRLLSSYDNYLPISFFDTKVELDRNYTFTSVTRFDYFSETWYENVSLGVGPSVWGNIYVTEGVYAEVVWSGESGLVDFVWGRGEIYPGEMEVWFEFDGQTSAYWSGNVEVIYGPLVGNYVFLTSFDGRPDVWQGLPTSARELYELLQRAVLAAGDSIWDGIRGSISTVWSYMKEGLEHLWHYISAALSFIGNFVIDLVGRIVAFLKNVVNFVGVILKGALWILPPSLILVGLAFVSDPSGAVEKVKEGKKRVKRSFQAKTYSDKLEKGFKKPKKKEGGK